MPEGPGEGRRRAPDGDDRPIQEQLDDFAALIESTPGVRFRPELTVDEEIERMYALMRKYPKAARGYAARLPT